MALPERLALSEKLPLPEKSSFTVVEDEKTTESANLPTYEEATVSEDNDPNLPQPMHVTAHLKLLLAFHKLKEEVLGDQTLLGIDDSWLPSDDSDYADDILKTHKTVAQARWDIYVNQAVLRFESWWYSLRKQIGSKGITVKDITLKEQTSPVRTSKKGFAIHAQTLPPLDVLMVWHSFLLSPRRYFEDCLLQGMTELWCTDFPWAEIDHSIDADGNYVPDKACKVEFAAIRPWSQSDDDCFLTVTCPGCRKMEFEIDSTEFSRLMEDIREKFEQNSLQTQSLLNAVTEALQKSKGWADAGFSAVCNKCKQSINRDTLSADKFIRDVERFHSVSSHSGTGHGARPSTFSITSVLKCSPMPGTILNPRTGLIHTYSNQNPTEIAKLDQLFPIVLTRVGPP